jgi:hypothetical protein
MVRKWIANPHATHFLHNSKRQTTSGEAAHVFKINKNNKPDFLSPQFLATKNDNQKRHKKPRQPTP